jgi:hypothetical protein
MLSDRKQQLLTAAVDGELNAREMRAVQRLLEESDEARRLYQSLASDASRLKGMRRKNLPLHFSCQVLQAIGERARATPSAFEPVARRWLPIWANVAAAAAVMLAVCAGSYLVIVLSEQDRANKDLAGKNTPRTEQTVPVKPGPAPALASNTGGRTDEPDKPEPIPVPPVAVNDRNDNKTPKVPDGTPEPDLLTGPFTPKVEFDVVGPAKTAPILTVRDLEQENDRRKLAEMLRKAESAHLDLFCHDTTKAFERLQTILRAQGQRLLIDVVAQERFNRKLKTYYAVYTDNLTANDVAKVFQQLAAEDHRAELRKDAQFDKLVVKPLSADSQKVLGQLLGVEPKWLQGRPKTEAPKSLTDSTAEKLAQRMADKAGKPADPIMLVVSYNPMRPSATASREVRQFLDCHKDPKHGNVPFLLVLRTVD